MRPRVERIKGDAGRTVCEGSVETGWPQIAQPQPQKCDLIARYSFNIWACKRHGCRCSAAKT